MSIAEFTKSLRDKANQQFSQDAQALLDRFVSNAVDAFKAGGMSRSASVLSKGEVVVGGKKVNLQEAFRTQGERQGRTRLILTEDDIQSIFKKYNISTDISPMALYAKFLSNEFKTYKASHFEIYLRNGSVIESDKKVKARAKITISEALDGVDLKEVIAIRGLNFSHDNTIKHVAHFLHHVNAFPSSSRKEIEKILTGDYDRGHVYAQTYGRALVSLGDLAEQDNILSKIAQLYQLLDEGSSSLSRLDGKYSELLSRAKKDFSDKNLFMNIQLQLKTDSGIGNRDTGALSSYIRIVGFLQNLVANSTLSKDGKRLISTPAAVSLKEFEKALTDFNNKLDKYKKNISVVLANSSSPDYLKDLQTSDSVVDYFIGGTKSVLDGKKVKPLKVNTPDVPVLKHVAKVPKLKQPSALAKQALNSLKNDLMKAKNAITKSKSVRVEYKRPSVTDLSSLMLQINNNLHDQIKANMGTGNRRDVLNYRSGRFAQSAKVERISESRQGMITAFYSYMKNPYATFSRGGRQERPYTRDPKTLISKSIRELAGQQVANRMRAVLV